MTAPPARKRSGDPLHAAAWWLWALGLAATASRTTNPMLLGLVLGVAGWVTAARRGDTPWSRSYGVFLRIGLFVVALRTLFHILLGAGTGTSVLFTLPRLPSPAWAAGIQLGGAVTAEGMAFALYDGFRLAVLLACVGAANSLADPRRLLRSLPGALYQLSLVVVVGLTVAPQMVSATRQVRRARRLRGDQARGWRALRSVLVPVLTDALERSLSLAAAMDSRGYGRASGQTPAGRRLTAALVLTGLLGMCLGAYGLLDVGSPSALGLPALGIGAALAVAGLIFGSRRTTRTRYRPDRWGWTDTTVAACGLVPVITVVAVAVTGGPGSADLIPSTAPLEFPLLPVLPALAVMVALLPARLAPAAATSRPTRPSGLRGAGPPVPPDSPAASRSPSPDSPVATEPSLPVSATPSPGVPSDSTSGTASNSAFTAVSYPAAAGPARPVAAQSDGAAVPS